MACQTISISISSLHIKRCMNYVCETRGGGAAASCLGSHCQMLSTSLSHLVRPGLHLMHQTAKSIYIYTVSIYVCVCVCRIICSSGLLFLGNSGRLIDCSRLAAMMRMMMMICNSFFLYFFFGQHREIRLNSRVIKLCYQRSLGHVTFLSFSAFPHSLPFPFSCLPPFLLCNFL